ncbi:Qat anti-phage system associated protein QatB [Sphingopyxis jiangsuensis]|uniref:Qat anti-phage system associated protein QatB n=1 Tax=Sphingopyxis jiangsuensis TaxID=2871171 RepID=UPI002ED22959
MGTSGTFGGSKHSLVPSWVGDPTPSASPPATDPNGTDGAPSDGDDGKSPVADAPRAYPPIRSPGVGSGLGDARGDITRGARNSDSRSVRRGASKYVSASGGGGGAARQMSSSRATAGGIANFARSFLVDGPVEALRTFNLEALAGAPAVDVFVALTDALCPPGGTIDEAIARDAMLETVAALAAEGVGNFDDMTQSDLQEFFIGVVSRSIEGKILNEVGTNSIRVAASVAAVERTQRMLHDFVDGCVRDRFDTTGTSLADITSGQIEGFVSDLYVAAFDLMQTLGEAQ